MFSFNYGKINRVWYVVLFSLLMAIQFAQVPFEKYVNTKLENNLNIEVEEMTFTYSKPSNLNVMEQRRIAKIQKAISPNKSAEEIIATTPSLSNLSESEQKLIVKLLEDMNTNNIDEESKKLLSDMNRFVESGPSSSTVTSPTNSYWAQLLLILGAIGFFNNFALLWLIMARVKDIGWKEVIGLGLFSPYFFILFVGPPAAVFYPLYTIFLVSLAALAFIPSNFHILDDGFPNQNDQLTTPSVPQSSRTGSTTPLFGKR